MRVALCSERLTQQCGLIISSSTTAAREFKLDDIVLQKNGGFSNPRTGTFSVCIRLSWFMCIVSIP